VVGHGIEGLVENCQKLFRIGKVSLRARLALKGWNTHTHAKRRKKDWGEKQRGWKERYTMRGRESEREKEREKEGERERK